MAYQRTSSASMYSTPGAEVSFSPGKFGFAPSNGHINIGATALLNDDEDFSFKEKLVLSENAKPLILFSIDISSCSPAIRFIVLIGGLILFMCLYGYYQELVIYGWFDRKLSIFSTFLHFLGCSFFAQLQRSLSQNHTSPGHDRSWWNLSMGTASPRLAIAYYLLLVLTKTAAQGLSNLSMTQINYPAKVLFKSANPIVTLILGVCWFKKSYPLTDYLVVLLLVLGLYIFITGDVKSAPSSTSLGIFYVVLSMLGSAGVPMIQEHCLNTFNASVEDLLYFSYVGSTLISLILSILNGEFMQGLFFLVQSGSLHTWLIFIAFCTFGFAGSNFSTAITAQYGALVNGISNTFRKAVTIIVSFFMFPDRNVLTARKIIGTAIFFLGLVVKILHREKAGTIKTRGVNSNNNNSSSNNNNGSASNGIGGGMDLEGKGVNDGLLSFPAILHGSAFKVPFKDSNLRSLEGGNGNGNGVDLRNNYMHV